MTKSERPVRTVAYPIRRLGTREKLLSSCQDKMDSNDDNQSIEQITALKIGRLRAIFSQ